MSRKSKRTAGWVSAVSVMALLGIGIVSGVGVPGAAPALSNIGSWLADAASGTVSHVNGTTGHVDARVQVNHAASSTLQVSQDGSAILVLDTSTGTVSRIDPSQLTIPDTHAYGTPDLSLVSAGDKAWLVDANAGTVQQIDPVSLAPLAAPVDLHSRPLGPAAADGNAVLWVTEPATGQVVPVSGSTPGTPIKVTEPGKPLQLTMADGTPVVVAPADATATQLAVGGAQVTVKLPSDVVRGDNAAVLTPRTTPSPLVPVLATDTGTLVLVNMATGTVRAVPLNVQAQHAYGAAQVVGDRVYVPDQTSGTLLVYDTTTVSFAPPVTVTGTAGPLETYVSGGMLWANDPGGAKAVVVDDQGVVHTIDKSEGSVPSGAPDTSDASAPVLPPSAVPSAPTEPTDTGADQSTSDTTEPPGTPTGDPTTTTGGSTDGGLLPAPPPPTHTRKPPQPTGGDTGGPTGVPSVPATVTVTAPVSTVTAPAPTTTTAAPTGTPVTQPSATATATSSVPQPSGTATATPSPSTTHLNPEPPGQPDVTSENGWILVQFPASEGPQPDSYVLDPTTVKGGVVAPTSVGPAGPFMFRVSELSCANEYSFVVVAVFGSTRLSSRPSVGVHPCVRPGEPTDLKVTAAPGGHGFSVSFGAPTVAGGTVTYKSSWHDESGGQSGGNTMDGPYPFSTNGQKNGHVFTVGVQAFNEAGSGKAETRTVSLNGPAESYPVIPTDPTTGSIVAIYAAPHSGTAPVASIPKGAAPSVKVLCQTTGENEIRDRSKGVWSTVWDEVTYNGATGYMSDLYVHTPNSSRAAFSYPPLWQCT